MQLSTDAQHRTAAPKDFFFPQSENLMDFKRDGQEDRDHRHRDASMEDFVVFGVRACDVSSF